MLNPPNVRASTRSGNMPKSVLRSVSLLLVSCLLADPAMATAFTCSDNFSNKNYLIPYVYNYSSVLQPVFWLQHPAFCATTVATCQAAKRGVALVVTKGQNVWTAFMLQAALHHNLMIQLWMQIDRLAQFSPIGFSKDLM